MTPAEAIYLLCAMTSLLAAALLLRYYLASRRPPLLLWSFVGFVGLAVNNVLVYVDLVLFPETDLVLTRAIAAASGMLAMMYGLIWEGSE
jgi:hypothetical protein